ncbi:hypothetical protein [Sphaerochaeta pleomorpha]|uniref:hypothetical protein n=1 Tax=Sphaerochaeta pleomorpha TaxID=1131707 RepID=UPI001C07E67C|nr:hypothetical protein [Sphaerochaeta pleomorpha]
MHFEVLVAGDTLWCLIIPPAFPLAIDSGSAIKGLPKANYSISTVSSWRKKGNTYLVLAIENLSHALLATERTGKRQFRCAQRIFPGFPQG